MLSARHVAARERPLCEAPPRFLSLRGCNPGRAVQVPSRLAAILAPRAAHTPVSRRPGTTGRVARAGCAGTRQAQPGLRRTCAGGSRAGATTRKRCRCVAAPAGRAQPTWGLAGRSGARSARFRYPTPTAI